MSSATDTPLRIGVVGAGAFGRNHLRVISQSERAAIAGVLDIDSTRAAEAAKAYNCAIFHSLEELAANAQGAVVATPTVTHAETGCRLMELGLDVLVEKPIAHSIPAAQDLIETANRTGKILQVGHLERYNPAVIALTEIATKPLFFEIHRLSEFSPRSLDVDVVLDLMIHDLDIVLALTRETPEEIRAAGISILTPKVDIANVRLQFPGGCVANLTASRVSTERVRKLRLFQPHEYISLDYTRRDVVRFRVSAQAAGRGVKGSSNSADLAAPGGSVVREFLQKPPMAIDFSPLPVTPGEPLRLEIEGFLEAISSRRAPRVTDVQALRALEAAFAVLDKIEVHSRRVAQALRACSGEPGGF
ncbi:MAG TPA: Gfo/Idh/MocA family oxidoreductase [Bryobacteraceae bacterium]